MTPASVSPRGGSLCETRRSRAGFCLARSKFYCGSIRPLKKESDVNPAAAHRMAQMHALSQAAPSVTAAFLGSLVEFVEALTIVLAVGSVRGWRPALTGAATGAVVLVAIVLLVGPLLSIVPLKTLQLAIGLLLLLFGMRWLRKAILRAGGVIARHDEAAAFAAETAHMRAAGPIATLRLDPIAVITTFKAVVLEGIEVVFIVIAVGAASHTLVPASFGAGVAGLLVVGLGILVHRPLARVPENALKFAVGVLISAFGCFWIGEGLGLPWPGEDLAIIAMALCLLIVGLAAAQLARWRVPQIGGEE
jgi:Ca2+/H+ antiporter, TMEM165/GDT1 family